MKTQTEHELLQNFADSLGLTVHEYRYEDKRKNIKFYVTDNGTSVSGKMDYEQCNHFFMGWMNAAKQLNKSKGNKN